MFDCFRTSVVRLKSLTKFFWVPVAHTCNCSYSGGRDQEDCGSKPAQANSLRDPISKKKPSQKRAGGVTKGVGTELKSQYQKKKSC
jgi:hypothetical protein